MIPARTSACTSREVKDRRNVPLVRYLLSYSGCWRLSTCTGAAVPMYEPVVHQFVSCLLGPADALWLHTLLRQGGPEGHRPVCKG